MVSFGATSFNACACGHRTGDFSPVHLKPKPCAGSAGLLKAHEPKSGFPAEVEAKAGLPNMESQDGSGIVCGVGAGFGAGGVVLVAEGVVLPVADGLGRSDATGAVPAAAGAVPVAAGEAVPLAETGVAPEVVGVALLVPLAGAALLAVDDVAKAAGVSLAVVVEFLKRPVLIGA